MTQVVITGNDGKPIRYAHLNGFNLVLQVEYLSSNEYEGDYEVIQTISQEEFVPIAKEFGLDPSAHILEIIQQISDLGRGEEFVAALDNKEIKCEIFTWLS
jgi:hypothetical protein